MTATDKSQKPPLRALKPRGVHLSSLEDALLSLSDRDEVLRFTALEMKSLDVSTGPVGPLLISLPIAQCTPPVVDRMKEILRSHPGKREVHMQIDDQGVLTTMKIDALVTASPSLSADLKSILGPDCLIRM